MAPTSMLVLVPSNLTSTCTVAGLTQTSIPVVEEETVNDWEFVTYPADEVENVNEEYEGKSHDADPPALIVSEAV